MSWNGTDDGIQGPPGACPECGSERGIKWNPKNGRSCCLACDWASGGFNPQPIIEFKSQEELECCLKEWQTRLFLDDWIIKVVLLEPHEMPDQDCAGYNNRFNTVKACKISIAKKSKDDADCLEKHCEEQVLVHELLHCKPWITHYAENGGTMAGCFIEQHEHTMLDQMAKSLIMAKYNLARDWFKNF